MQREGSKFPRVLWVSGDPREDSVKGPGTSCFTEKEMKAQSGHKTQ